MPLASRDVAVDQYRANARYLSDPTGSMARLFIEAANVLLQTPEGSRGTEGEATKIVDRRLG